MVNGRLSACEKSSQVQPDQMKLPLPSRLSFFQLFAAIVLVSLFTTPADTIAHGPMIILKGGHGSSHSTMAAAGLVAAGLAYKLLSGMGKNGGGHHHHGGGFGGGGYGAQMIVPDAGYGYMPEAHGGMMMWR
ncbi:hypothetical protein JTE90_005271 [Oedothorax gibbosus]|uniref:Uncharacterized protein n=1 Tax=Oedothorax gibbosus TaxID=931172 RepID=A0AAV6U328_9ARAC|nr:hypothetical protein JTE90_005271 [Oedothorax gibbosus]